MIFPFNGVSLNPVATLLLRYSSAKKYMPGEISDEFEIVRSHHADVEYPIVNQAFLDGNT
jgi:hypothetical protein